MQLAALGLFVFELATFPFQDIERSSEWRHAAAARVGERDAHQYVGPGDETVSIAGAIMPEAAGSFGSIDTLRRMADEGDAHTFLAGNGRVWGSFVITRLRDRHDFLLADGVARKVDFQIELKRVA
jgi:hypothetical protein